MNKSSTLISISVSAAMNAPNCSHALQAGRCYTYQVWDIVSLKDASVSRQTYNDTLIFPLYNRLQIHATLQMPGHIVWPTAA